MNEKQVDRARVLIDRIIYDCDGERRSESAMDFEIRTLDDEDFTLIEKELRRRATRKRKVAKMKTALRGMQR